MEVPILKQGPYLIATIQTALHDADLVQLRDAIVEKVGKSRSRGVIIDVTALDVIDSFSTRTLKRCQAPGRGTKPETVRPSRACEPAFSKR